MFGSLGKVASLLGNMGQLKETMAGLQERLKNARFVGEAGAGQARATVDGQLDLLKIEVDPALAKSGDSELMIDLVTAAVRDALHKGRQGLMKEFETATGGLGLPDISALFGGTPRA